MSPSPLLRDVCSLKTLAPSEARSQPPPPLPFPKGCGWLILTSTTTTKMGRSTYEDDVAYDRDHYLNSDNDEL
jgi:hypothetical protein